MIVGITELTNDKNDRERKSKKGDYRTTSGNQEIIGLQNDRISDCR